MIRARFLLCAMLFAAPFTFSDSVVLGVAPYEQLGKEYYIGALYLADAENSNQPQRILTDTRAQKMVIKVTASRWSERKFTEVWRQDLTLNNDMAADAALTGLMLDFTRFPKEKLTTGDEIIIHYRPTTGTEVLLNNEVVMKAEGKAFFNSLVRSWIGEVPHSRVFQQQILGDSSQGVSTDKLLSRISATAIQSARVSLVSGWQAAEAAARQAVLDAEKARLAAERREEEVRRQAAAEKKRLEEERQQALALAEQRRKEAAEAAKKEDSVSAQKALEEQRAAEQKARELAAAQEQNDEALEMEKQQQLAVTYAKDLYQWEVMRDVYKRISYPEWARQFNQEGVVEIEFIVGKQGQLLGVSRVNPADGFLAQELKDAVNRAAPFDPFPVNINDGQIRISFGYEFTLEERVAELPEAPVAPAGLPTEEDMTSVQKAVAWAKYKDQVTAELESAIEYPFWAQDLKQEGEVSAEVTIRADGTISKVKIKKRSRHNILNQEVEQAMDRVGSVASFPGWVKDDALTVLIEHTFKL